VELYLMMQYKQNKKKSKKVLLLISAGVLMLLLVSAGLYFFGPFSREKNDDSRQSTQDISNSNKTPSSNEVDYSGPSDSDINESQNAKKNSESNNTSQNSTIPSTKTSVSVAVSYADIYNGNLEVRAFTSDVIEGTGTCTVTATKGDARITESSTAFIDVSTTQCNPIYISQSRLSPGTWIVTVSFSSPDKEGVSDKIKVAVQ